MARRIAAFIGMVGVIALALIVVWKVYEHRRVHVPSDEPTIVQRAQPHASKLS
jgi:hypothetical protein